jgi:hypothetical protein
MKSLDFGLSDVFGGHRAGFYRSHFRRKIEKKEKMKTVQKNTLEVSGSGCSLQLTGQVGGPCSALHLFGEPDRQRHSTAAVPLLGRYGNLVGLDTDTGTED